MGPSGPSAVPQGKENSNPSESESKTDVKMITLCLEIQLRQDM